jgi:hypothetical protein
VTFLLAKMSEHIYLGLWTRDVSVAVPTRDALELVAKLREPKHASGEAVSGVDAEAADMLADHIENAIEAGSPAFLMGPRNLEEMCWALERWSEEKVPPPQWARDLASQLECPSHGR